jgi:hypothetical protein
MRLARVAVERIEHDGAGGGYCSATSGVTAMWSEIISRSKPRPSTVCAQRRNRPGAVPGPKFGTFTPIRTGQGYRAATPGRNGYPDPGSPAGRARGRGPNGPSALWTWFRSS